MTTRTYTRSLLLFGLLFLLIGCKRPIEFNPNDLVDARDGNRYSTIVYGDQRWMAENLNYDLNHSRINPNNPITEYGRLYTFEQASVACPSGWHLPTDAEWQIMEQHLGMDAVELGFRGYRGGIIGRGLKSSTGWLLKNGSNEFEFNIYPVGLYNNTKNAFEELTSQAYLWTASDAGNGEVFYRGLTKDFDGIYRAGIEKGRGLSCRCLED
ncbi:MAG: Unknown protein [uncultured Aureispira sp.]|jgi:uncharacterized protein (TIGR02145 family)|uniref:Fibrobacter succinogenes major paralogous domain-containing protein n=1 Tax=uncultured Aureispira sp. TaxID=1331704 RepID=A0A6S6U731_9BACT|nr:MAG: Unknown protein [uncultured Aureispira sp.]